MDDLLEATGGRGEPSMKYHAGSVVYITPNPPDFAEAGELKDKGLVAAQRMRNER